ncbi:TetR/AcrR family transcriptional regulator [Conexibacter sp. DBS9H8]|uniref:TetR/AcrR family transcriptional regulator n=1 Tax=Conexibacter sp. DBS9H8 TaxID=2937801 RepID=UPI00200F7511|nr:TetR/AcrR family transcriptional regulator [Conexibacter sp. DBS9H8]
MTRPATLTPKGERAAQEILEAAVRCVARDGLAAASMQRIADEAGVAKRSVVYYYGTRAGLLDAVIRRVGDGMLDELEAVVRGVDDPVEIVSRGFEVLWAAITTDRALLAAWFGLHAEAVTTPAFRCAARYISGRLEQIVTELITIQLERGRVLRYDRAAVEVLVVANVQGLATYYLEHGDVAPLRTAIATFQHFLAREAFAPRA